MNSEAIVCGFHVMLSSYIGILIMRLLAVEPRKTAGSSSGRTDLAIHFQPSWPTTSECFSYWLLFPSPYLGGMILLTLYWMVTGLEGFKCRANAYILSLAADSIFILYCFPFLSFLF